ncbi:hypothetical protein QW060_27225 [Myroides ceti]|uniref:Uncharacterized protein n=1 Tax=Paenimyroides ceti TaxID=395087 RepID=A0ABT8D3I5_9FLAO|nr:hypothetical protein [Paenimyroides ceti]MDN3710496.1 hypothetical protein [Paenimyroides ceti]
MIIYDSHTLIFENISVDIVLCHRRIIAISDIAGTKPSSKDRCYRRSSLLQIHLRKTTADTSGKRVLNTENRISSF